MYWIQTCTYFLFYLQILYRQWPLGRETEWLCRLAKSYQTTPMFMSSFSIMAIALDRYRCIMQPDKRQLTTNVSVLISLAMVMIAFGMSAPLMFGSNLEDYVDFKGSMDGYLDDILICNDVRTAEIRYGYIFDYCIDKIEIHKPCSIHIWSTMVISVNYLYMFLGYSTTLVAVLSNLLCLCQ